MGLKINKINCFLIVFSLLHYSEINGQSTILENYIYQGLTENIALKQKQLSYEKSIYALKEAKGMFLPQLSFNARYTVAQGGRVIDLPVGDMLNPVYTTLNQLTQASPNPFPLLTIDNEEIMFLRPTEHETKMRLVQPVFNPQIKYNKEIKQEFAHVAKSDENAYKQELVFEIKSAYYNYLKTLRVLSLLEETSLLVEENIRVNEKLFQNEKITMDVVYRAKAEKGNLEYQIAVAEKNNTMAATYFNFLLNRPFHREIEVDSSIYFNQPIFDLKSSIQEALVNRHELKILEYYNAVTELNYKLNKSNKLPNVVTVIDYGFQGEKYTFDDKSDFLLASAVLQWDLFKGFQNNAKIQQAKIEQHQIALRMEETTNQIQLQVENAFYEVEAAYKSVSAAKAENEAIQKAYNLVAKKYANEQANLLEFIDARNTLTTSSEKLIIAQYEALIKIADFEKIVGLYQPK